MASFLIVTLGRSGLEMRPAVAADLPTLEANIETVLKGLLRTGLPSYLGQPDLDTVATSAPSGIQSSVADGEILVGIVQLDAGTKLAPGVSPATPVSNWNNRRGAAIPDLAGGANLATTVAKVNAILASLRNFGVIAP